MHELVKILQILCLYLWGISTGVDFLTYLHMKRPSYIIKVVADIIVSAAFGVLIML